ncbi:type II toxin-antitoxin system RelE/ParE family toxin [Streptococcus panodentis]|uniref:Type II toxin-antitoxin system RelE/ParE family toxin n=1 Tax=Streptococcus panodentis TaxID=1581472 RepID=A0ABS5B0C4_9STRE|nr:type II toxin-antitoxin system RelE/ParE family toxin [Streptococcus panodentis]
MTNYRVIVSAQVLRDAREAVFYKQGLGVYPENLAAFKKDLADFVKRLELSPKVGSNLSARIPQQTAIKYRVIQDYILFYEIAGQEVYVLRLLPAKSDWMQTILKEL